MKNIQSDSEMTFLRAAVPDRAPWTLKSRWSTEESPITKVNISPKGRQDFLLIEVNNRAKDKMARLERLLY